MTAYWVGDAPSEPLLIAPARDGKPVDLDPFTGAEAALTSPAGVTTAAAAALVDEPGEGRVVAVTIPAAALLEAGLHELEVRLTTAGTSERFEVPPVVVQARSGWHSIGSARTEWRDAGALDDHRLWVLLETAKLEVVAYAPPLPDGARPPVNYREAQLMHARNRNAAGRIDPANADAGGDGFSLTAFPLDWVVRQLLRPQRAIKRVR